MEKFIVSARKYRPQTFDTVVGQEHITTTLKNAIRNKQLAHAFLFCGPRGVGKTTCARILAKTINCENITPEGEACNTCSSCVSFNDGNSLNIHELDAASNNSVDDIRTLVEQVRFAPQAGTYKVYIIDEVHMLSASAFNAFLKTLEEPPPYAIFILATTEKHKILPTILSRCQIFDFKRITTNDTVEHLENICEKENIQAEKAALQVIAQKSEGCMRDALSIMDKIVSFTNGELTYRNTLEHLNILDADYYFRMLEAMQQQDLASALLLYDDINRKGFEGDQVLNGFSEFLRNLLVCKDSKAMQLLEVVESFRDKYADAAAKTNASFLISALNILNEAEMSFKSARNKRLHIELALIRLSYLQQALELTSGEEGLSKKKLLDTVTPVSFRNLPYTPARDAKTKTDTRSDKTSEAKLIIENESRPVVPSQVKQAVPPFQNNPAAATSKPQPVASSQNTAIQNNPAAATSSQNIQPPRDEKTSPKTPENKPPNTRLSLREIREKYSGQNTSNANQVLPLQMDLLQKLWNDFAAQLKANKNPAYNSIENAKLNILDQGSFEVITNNNLEQKFIEQEKRPLSEYLQDAFRNRSLFFSVVVADVPMHYEPTEKILNKRDQFIMLVEKYPLVKELKDRLRLELDY